MQEILKRSMNVVRLGVVLLLACTAVSRRVQANVAELGPGFLLGTVATITSDPAEVISGKQSIKGSYRTGIAGKGARYEALDRVELPNQPADRGAGRRPRRGDLVVLVQ